MIEVVPVALQATPPADVLVQLAEQGGPFAGVAALLWWRIDRLEQRLSRRVDRLEDDVDSNSSAIYDHALPLSSAERGDLDRGDRASD